MLTLDDLGDRGMHSLLPGRCWEVEDSVSLLLTSLLRQHSWSPFIYHSKTGWVEAPLGNLKAETWVLSALGTLHLPRVYSTPPSLRLHLKGARRQGPSKKYLWQTGFPKDGGNYIFHPTFLLIVWLLHPTTEKWGVRPLPLNLCQMSWQQSKMEEILRD